MKIVVLDGYTLNPGDLSWAMLETLGTLTVYERSPSDTVARRIEDAEIVFTNKTKINKEIIDCSPKLKFIGVLATGFDVVDIAYAKEKDIVVTNVPGYGTDTVAQHTFALILELANRVGNHDESVKQLRQGEQSDFCFWNYQIFELKGKTLGIIGYGRIGQEVAKIANAFGMIILVYSEGEIAKEYNVQKVDLEDLLTHSDIITLHVPLTTDTENMIDEKALGKMKSNAILINTARGALINENDLFEVLKNKKIYGAAIDVMRQEPIDVTNPLLTLENCIITPHIAWAAKEARKRLMDIAIDNLKSFLETGEAKNRI